MKSVPVLVTTALRGDSHITPPRWASQARPAAGPPAWPGPAGDRIWPSPRSAAGIRRTGIRGYVWDEGIYVEEGGYSRALYIQLKHPEETLKTLKTINAQSPEFPLRALIPEFRSLESPSPPDPLFRAPRVGLLFITSPKEPKRQMKLLALKTVSHNWLEA